MEIGIKRPLRVFHLIWLKHEIGALISSAPKFLEKLLFSQIYAKLQERQQQPKISSTLLDLHSLRFG